MLKSIKNGSGNNAHEFVSVEKYRHLTDMAIIKRILSGSVPLFEVLMRRYNQRLFRVQRSYISDEEAIKDTLQLTYIKVFENLDKFRGDSQFSTWIIRIAINEALKYLKKEKRFIKLHLVDGNKHMNEHTINYTDTPEENSIQNDFKDLLEKVVGNLPPKYSSVYIMRELENLNTKETSECLNISVSNVKVRLHRANQLIKEEIERNIENTEIFDFLGERCDALVIRVMNIIQPTNE